MLTSLRIVFRIAPAVALIFLLVFSASLVAGFVVMLPMMPLFRLSLCVALLLWCLYCWERASTLQKWQALVLRGEQLREVIDGREQPPMIIWQVVYASPWLIVLRVKRGARTRFMPLLKCCVDAGDYRRLLAALRQGRGAGLEMR
ncbi:MAG TPA: hypothetical protein DCZ13_06285 [Porticoccaceae bacterium]|nr:hypothetical protein [Porticoccaceae bacterium]